MKTLILLTALSIAAFMFSCEGHSHDHGKKVHDHSTHKASFAPGQSGVELNNGKKWKANIETTQGIEAMQQIAGNYKEGDNVETFKEDLEKEFKTIFKKCTMTGEAHNQLHNYLIPIKNKLKNIQQGNVAENAKDLQKYLETYYSYFE